jgi:hypothetical protein
LLFVLEPAAELCPFTSSLAILAGVVVRRHHAFWVGAARSHAKCDVILLEFHPLVHARVFSHPSNRILSHLARSTAGNTTTAVTHLSLDTFVGCSNPAERLPLGFDGLHAQRHRNIIATSSQRHRNVIATSLKKDSIGAIWQEWGV